MNPRPSLVAVLLLAACSGGPAEDALEVTEALPRKLFNHLDTRLVIKGANLLSRETGKQHAKLRVLLWAGTRERLVRALSLAQVEATSASTISAVLRAGAYPGSYRVVLQTKKTTIFSEATVTVEQLPQNVGPPQVTRVEGQVFSDVPGRLYLTGANLQAVKGVRLRNASDVDVVQLSRLRNYNSARVGDSLAGGLVPPGSYRLVVGNRRGWAVGPAVEVVRSGHGDEATLTFSIYFGVLGSVFLVGCVLAGLQGDLGLRRGRGRRNLVLLLSGLVFTFVMLGTVQFFLSWWS